MSPSRKRRAAADLQQKFSVSERRACQAFEEQPRSTQRYEPKPRGDELALAKGMLKVAGDVRGGVTAGAFSLAASARRMESERHACLSSVASGRAESASRKSGKSDDSGRVRTAVFIAERSAEITSGAGTLCLITRRARAYKLKWLSMVVGIRANVWP